MSTEASLQRCRKYYSSAFIVRVVDVKDSDDSLFAQCKPGRCAMKRVTNSKAHMLITRFPTTFDWGRPIEEKVHSIRRKNEYRKPKIAAVLE